MSTSLLTPLLLYTVDGIFFQENNITSSPSKYFILDLIPHNRAWQLLLSWQKKKKKKKKKKIILL